MKLTDTKVLSPDETPDGKHWYAVVRSYWVKAENREHAERIIEVCEASHAIGVNEARFKMRDALGM